MMSSWVTTPTRRPSRSTTGAPLMFFSCRRSHSSPTVVVSDTVIGVAVIRSRARRAPAPFFPGGREPAAVRRSAPAGFAVRLRLAPPVEQPFGAAPPRDRFIVRHRVADPYRRGDGVGGGPPHPRAVFLAAGACQRRGIRRLRPQKPRHPIDQAERLQLEQPLADG